MCSFIFSLNSDRKVSSNLIRCYIFIMHLLIFLTASFPVSLALALNTFQDSVGPFDNSEVVDASILNGNNPMPSSDAFNLGFNSEMPEFHPIIPQANGNGPASSSDVKPLVVNWGIPEAYGNNPVPEPQLDAPGLIDIANSVFSIPVESSKVEEHSDSQSNDPISDSDNLKLLTLDAGTSEAHSNSPVPLAGVDPIPSVSLISTASVDETWNSINGQVPNGSENLISNAAEDCTVDDTAAGAKDRTLSCPKNMFYHRRGQSAASYGSSKAQQESNTAKARRDHRWYLQNFKSGRDPPTASDDFKDLCLKLSAKLNAFATHKVDRLVALCCLGPSYYLDPPETIVMSPTISIEVTDEDQCGHHYPYRPLCEEIADQFCCERHGASLSHWFLKGYNCVLMR